MTKGTRAANLFFFPSRTHKGKELTTGIHSNNSEALKGAFQTKYLLCYCETCFMTLNNYFLVF